MHFFEKTNSSLSGIPLIPDIFFWQLEKDGIYLEFNKKININEKFQKI